MSRLIIGSFRRMAALGLVASICLAGSAHALFPPPFFYPPGVIQGGDDPPPPPPPPTEPCNDPPLPPPPDTCGCPHVRNTPEPATVVSALVGAALFGGLAWRRRAKK